MSPSIVIIYNKIYMESYQIQDWIAEMAVTYSDIAELITLDTLSFEGRPITLLKVSCSISM